MRDLFTLALELKQAAADREEALAIGELYGADGYNTPVCTMVYTADEKFKAAWLALQEALEEN